MNDQSSGNLSFAEKRELQRLIIEQNKVIASETASDFEKNAANRIKSEALMKLGIMHG